MKRLAVTTLASLAMLVPVSSVAVSELAGVKPHIGCWSNDRRDTNNAWCLWDARHMKDGAGDKHDHSGWFDRRRTWHPKGHDPIHFACERRCFH